MKAEVARQGTGTRPQDVYGDVFGDDANWMDAFAKRQAHLNDGKLSPKMRALTFVVGFLVNRYPAAARVYQDEARQAGASDGDFKVLLKIMDFYRGLRGFQDAQRLVSFWKTGLFPEIKPPHEGKTEEIFAEIVATRKYIANGFRVYGADGQWLRLYLQRSNAIKRSPTTLDEREIQILSLAITLKNHGYSDNFNDGCIEVHELKAKSLGAGHEETLEIVQIMELCDSMTTAWEGRTVLDLAV